MDIKDVIAIEGWFGHTKASDDTEWIEVSSYKHHFWRGEKRERQKGLAQPRWYIKVKKDAKKTTKTDESDSVRTTN